MKKTNLLSAYLVPVAAAFAVLAACTDGDDARHASSQAIRLTSAVGGAVTRSFDSQNLRSGDTCYVWADMVNAVTGRQTKYFESWTLLADGVGGLTPQDMSTQKLFPATNALNFYGLTGNFGRSGEDPEKPYITPETTPLPVTGIVHTVLADQRQEAAYYKSDLLYAVRKGQEPVSQAVVLPFQHLLARVQVVIVAGNGLTTADLTNSTTTTVRLLNLKRQVTFSPDSAKSVVISTDPDVSAASRANLVGMLSTPAGGAVSDILMATQLIGDPAAATASAAYADAIVVPQTILAGTRFVEVDYLDRQTYYTLPADLELKSGSQYRLRLIVDRIGEAYELNTVQVEDWGSATSAKPVWLDNVVTP